MGASFWPTTRIVDASAAASAEEADSSAKAVVELSATASAIIDDLIEILGEIAALTLDMIKPVHCDA